MPLDQCRDPAGCPQIGAVAGFQRSLREQSNQFSLLNLRDLQRSTGCCFRLQAVSSLLPVRLVPPRKRTLRTTNGGHDFRQLPALLDQSDGLKTPVLQLVGTPLGSHAPKDNTM